MKIFREANDELDNQNVIILVRMKKSGDFLSL